MGFKEIEVGFPAASETEFEFLRYLVDHDLIPDDVTVQVLTQAREHIIRRTFEALKGVKNAIVHVYNSTSFAQRQQVFHKSKDEIKAIAVEGAVLLKRLTEEAGATTASNIRRKALLERNRNTPSMSATPSSTFGSRRPTARPSSICRRRCRCPCLTSLPRRSLTSRSTSSTATTSYCRSIPTTTGGRAWPMPKWPSCRRRPR